MSVTTLSERKKIITIIFDETGERFEVEKKIALPIAEALRAYKAIKESTESVNTDISVTAKILLALSETPY